MSLCRRDWPDLFTASRCRATGPMTIFAWHVAMVASFSYAIFAPLLITWSVLVLSRSGSSCSIVVSFSQAFQRLATHLQVPAGRWTCPHHFCCVCEKKSQDCSNCLFRCLPISSPASAAFRTRSHHAFDYLNAFTDARCARVHSARTASLMTCLSFRSTTADSPKGYDIHFCFTPH